MKIYPERSRQQRYGSMAHNLVTSLVDEAEVWIPRRQDEDFGIDLELELSEPDVRGELLKLQIKSVKTATVKKEKVRMRLPRALVAQADNLRIPVILVWVDRESRTAYYLWVQRWFLRKRAHGSTLTDFPETITLWVPVTRTLQRGLRGELKDIARWRTSEQLALSLAATIRTAVAINDARILTPLSQMLASLKNVPDGHTVNEVIDSVIELGGQIWRTEEGYKKAKFLYDVCGALGDRFTAEQIERMVLRGDAYSRTGINALGMLYDYHVGHLAGMKLVRRFTRLEQPAIAYFCALRETHPGKTVVELLSDETKLVANGLRCSHDHLFDKWANRGDSALLDYLKPVE